MKGHTSGEVMAKSLSHVSDNALNGVVPPERKLFAQLIF